jgi:hypothetical protein
MIRSSDGDRCNPAGHGGLVWMVEEAINRCFSRNTSSYKSSWNLGGFCQLIALTRAPNHRSMSTGIKVATLMKANVSHAY